VEVGADRWQLWRLALSEVGRAVARALRRLRSSLRLRSWAPTRLLFAPQDLRTSDATIAQDIYGGYFVFGGRAVQTAGVSPFAVEPPSSAWSEGLYGFAWLRHLRAANTALARENARALVSEAMGSRHRLRAAEAHTTPVVSRRLISFLCQSPLLLTGADHVFYHRLMRAVGLAVRDLERRMIDAPSPIDRLLAAIGLTYAGLCCEGYEAKLRRATRVLSAELDAQILPDGGHVGRNPSTLIELLLDLLPLRQVFTSRNVEPPEALERAIQRMLPMLRLFRHGDGTLGLFNGMGRAAPDHLATLVSYDPVRGEPAQHASYSGYDRIEAGSTVLIADVGGCPPPDLSGEAHAGCLSFELSSGLDRIVVNCGAPALGGALRQAARATAAHSTLVLGDASSGRFLPPDSQSGVAGWLQRRLGPIMLAGPCDVQVDRRTEADGSTKLVGRHDGYLARFGYLHERELRLSAGGGRLDGVDRLAANGADIPERTPNALICFHLHPGIDAELTEDGEAVLLRVRRPDAERPGLWLFTLPNPAGEGAAPPLSATLALDESVFFADADGRRATRRIVVGMPAGRGGRPTPLAWRFERIDP
jgi:uncharacterized heparinase superfamily protein